jgi:hypothetical protein
MIFVYIGCALIIGAGIGFVIGVVSTSKLDKDLNKIEKEILNLKVAVSTSKWARKKALGLFDTGRFYAKSYDPVDIDRATQCFSQAIHLMHESGKMIDRGLDGTLTDIVDKANDDEEHKSS